MRLNTLRMRNFRGFEDREFNLHPEFNLIVGENGAGKTSFLEAASVAIASWLLGIGGLDARNMRNRDIRVVRDFVERRYRELPQYPVQVSADGCIQISKASRNIETGEVNYQQDYSTDKGNPWHLPIKWSRSIEGEGGRTTRSGAAQLKSHAEEMVQAVLNQDPYILPLLRYFAVGRLWDSVRDTERRAMSKHKGKHPTELADDADELDKLLFDSKRMFEPFYGYRMSVDGRCNAADLIRWIAFERRNELDEEEESAALRLVYKAIESLLPEAKSVRYSVKLRTLVIQHHDNRRLTFNELSDGYRNVVAIAADLAIKASMLNPQLAEKALIFTPGVVLIDELDLHLHPKWQRRIIKDLRRTFPKIQFICTTHSPQLIGEAKADEIIVLDTEEGPHPGQSFGMDSNWILRHVMGSDDRDPEVAIQLDTIFEDIEEARFKEASAKIATLRSDIGEHPDLVEAEALISRYSRFDNASEQ